MPSQPWKPKSPYSGAPMPKGLNNMAKAPPMMPISGSPPGSAPASKWAAGKFAPPPSGPRIAKPLYPHAVTTGTAIEYASPPKVSAAPGSPIGGVPSSAYGSSAGAGAPPATTGAGAPPAGVPEGYWQGQAAGVAGQDMIMDPEAWQKKAAEERARIAADFGMKQYQLQQQIAAGGGGFGGGGFVQMGSLAQAEIMAKAASDNQIALEQAKLGIEEKIRELQALYPYAELEQKRAIQDELNFYEQQRIDIIRDQQGHQQLMDYAELARVMHEQGMTVGQQAQYQGKQQAYEQYGMAGINQSMVLVAPDGSPVGGTTDTYRLPDGTWMAKDPWGKWYQVQYDPSTGQAVIMG